MNTKRLNAPIIILLATLLACLWFEFIEFGAAVFLVLLILVTIKFGCFVVSDIKQRVDRFNGKSD